MPTHVRILLAVIVVALAIAACDLEWDENPVPEAARVTYTATITDKYEVFAWNFFELYACPTNTSGLPCATVTIRVDQTTFDSHDVGDDYSYSR